MRLRFLLASFLATTATIAGGCGQTENDSTGTQGGSGGAPKGGSGGALAGGSGGVGGIGGTTGGVGGTGAVGAAGAGGTIGGTGGIGAAGLGGTAGLDASADTGVDAADSAPETSGSCTIGASGFQLLGPLQYRSLADSPIKDCVATFYLEDFEDHSLNTLGLTASAGFVTSTQYTQDLIDSVDGDDGVVGNGICFKSPGSCDTWFYASAATGVTFSFNSGALGGYPTYAGVVWTDGSGQVTFQAYGPLGTPIGKIGPISDGTFPDMSFSNTTAEDRFFGLYSAAGISAIFISNSTGAIEVDHIQYGM